MNAFDLIAAAGTEPCHPWPRHVLSRPDWAAMATALASDPNPSLVALWADTVQVHALLLDETTDRLLPVSVAVESGVYPALSPVRPCAIWFERLVQDLWGHAAEGGRDLRPWLDHGKWPHSQPLAPRPGPPFSAANPPEFLTTGGEGLMQVPLGPIHGTIEGAAHVRLTSRGETVQRAESRLGYTHKGTLTLMRGKSPRAAARFAARLAGDATVAHSLGFARATEAALEVVVPPRAATLRAVMAEIERIAGLLGDIAAQADIAGLAALHADCGLSRELFLRAADSAFGHRLMMDCVIPGGVAADIAVSGREAVRSAVRALDTALPPLRRRLEPLLTRLEGVGVLDSATVTAWAAGGVVGRAAGRSADARRFDPTYAAAAPARCLERASDASARCRVRMALIADSMRLVGTLLDTLPGGAVSVPLPTASGEGIGCAESIRGDVWHWLRLDHGQIAATFPRDAGWALWPLAEIAMAGRSVEEAEVILRSFGLAASAVDL